MRVRLRGINSKRKRLADGSLRTLLLRVERRAAIAWGTGDAGVHCVI